MAKLAIDSASLVYCPNLSTLFSVFLSISFLVPVYLPFFLAHILLHSSSHVQFSLFYVIFLSVDATFTDPLRLACSFLILYCFVTPNIHPSILNVDADINLHYRKRHQQLPSTTVMPTGDRIRLIVGRVDTYN